MFIHFNMSENSMYFIFIYFTRNSRTFTEENIKNSLLTFVTKKQAKCRK